VLNSIRADWHYEQHVGECERRASSCADVMTMGTRTRMREAGVSRLRERIGMCRSYLFSDGSFLNDAIKDNNITSC
jgi:hypothetical protein